MRSRSASFAVPDYSVVEADSTDAGPPTDTLRSELLQMSALSTPLVLSQMLGMLTATTDSIFLGHIDEDSLAASGIGATLP